MTSKAFLKLVLPPFVLEIYRALWCMASPSADRFVYAPHGPNTRLPAARGRSYESAGAIAFYRDDWAPFVKGLQSAHTKLVMDFGPDPDSRHMAYEHISFMTFGYVLALAEQADQPRSCPKMTSSVSLSFAAFAIVGEHSRRRQRVGRGHALITGDELRFPKRFPFRVRGWRAAAASLGQM